MTTPRFTVWWETLNGADGDDGFDTLEDAMERFQEKRGQENVLRGTLTDNTGAEPVDIHSFNHSA